MKEDIIFKKCKYKDVSGWLRVVPDDKDDYRRNKLAAVLVYKWPFRPKYGDWKIPEDYGIRILPGIYYGPNDPHLKEDIKNLIW